MCPRSGLCLGAHILRVIPCQFRAKQAKLPTSTERYVLSVNQQAFGQCRTQSAYIPRREAGLACILNELR